MGLPIHSHTWSKWEKDYVHCKYVRHCMDVDCDAEDWKMEHNWSKWYYASEGSCKAKRHCQKCGEVELGKKYHHVWDNLHFKYDDKCLALRNCTRCGIEGKKHIVHEWGVWQYKGKDECLQVRFCRRCEEEQIQKKEKHEWDKIGFVKYVCKRCNRQKTIRNYLTPKLQFSKRLKRVRPNSRGFRQKENKRIKLLNEIIETERAENFQRIQKHKSINREFNISIAFFRDNFFLDRLVIDSNIWMDDRPEYDEFVYVLEYLLTSFNDKYIFLGPQYEEIYNKKKRTKDRKTEDDIKENRRAICAINRIDKLSGKDLLQIEKIESEHEYKGHVDPMIIKLLQDEGRAGKRVALLTNDSDLRIRAREILKISTLAHFRIFKMDDLYKHVKNIKTAIDKGIVDDFQIETKNVIYL